jgi:hypothetical protein
LFLFENFWIQHPGFKETVSNTWKLAIKVSNSVNTLNAKLNNVTVALKKWSKSISQLSLLIEKCQTVLTQIDELEQQRTLSTPEWNFRKILKAHITRLQSYKQQYWKKRCTERWIKYGDENTIFFHRIATERHRRNNIASITLSDGSNVQDHEGKAQVLFLAYKQRLGVSEPHEMRFDLSALFSPLIGLEAISTPFSKEEIDNVVKKIPIDKAPGPDGFNGCFLKTC